MNFQFDSALVFAVMAAVVCVPIWIVVKSIKMAITLTTVIGLGALAVYFLT